jgi:hypothetical protein
MSERILYLPVMEPGANHERAVANKHGLRTAFETIGPTIEWDFLANDRETRFEGLLNRLDSFAPTLLFTQLGSADVFTAEQLRAVRAAYPALRLVNWNGDVWNDPLVSPSMLELLREVDLQLVVNASVLETYAREGIDAAFWPFGYETALRVLPDDVPEWDVVYLANNYSEARGDLYRILRGLPYKVGIYGCGWEQYEGECVYDFTMGEALYRRAKIAISDNQFPDAKGYLSNRPFQAMAAGCFLLQQRVDDLYEYTGLVGGIHYVDFVKLEELPGWIDYFLRPEQEPDRVRIARNGQAFVQQYHSFDVRVRELLVELLPSIKEKQRG